jgi:hypothetical protein
MIFLWWIFFPNFNLKKEEDFEYINDFFMNKMAQIC